MSDNDGPDNGPYSKRSSTDYEIEWYNGTIGAGGQAHQKTKTCARIKHIPTGIIRTAQTRSRVNSLQNAMKALNEDLDKKRNESKWHTVNGIRKEQVGSGERSDKRRTLRFQADEVIDHLTGKRTTIEKYMKGGMHLLW